MWFPTLAARTRTRRGWGTQVLARPRMCRPEFCWSPTHSAEERVMDGAQRSIEKSKNVLNEGLFFVVIRHRLGLLAIAAQRMNDSLGRGHHTQELPHRRADGFSHKAACPIDGIQCIGGHRVQPFRLAARPL